MVTFASIVARFTLAIAFTISLYLLGSFKQAIGPRRYKDMVNAMARVNLATIDAKVTIDLKRILRLPSSLHSKVSMKCVEVKNPETFDPFKHAVPKFVYERKDEEIAEK